MSRLGDLLTRHRNTFLAALLIVTLILGSHSHSDDQAVTTVSIPVVETASASVSAVESFRQQRDQAARADIAALERLIGQDHLDEQTRLGAAERLQTIIDARQVQLAIEGALTMSSLYPCAAVLQDGILSIVTEKSAITERDAALVMTLAADHGGIAPEDVRIICGK